MEGQIYINGLIGSTAFETGVELIDIIAQVKKQPSATSFTVHINSEGGVVVTGFDIYNYLKSLNLPITTIGSELVASIATVIFMAGDVRKLKPNTSFMIHLPQGYVEGTADEINQYGEMVKGIEKDIIKFYKDILNVSEEAITPLLNNETYLTEEQAKALGFVNSEFNVEPIMARAIFNNNKKENEMITKSDLKEFFDPIMAIINKPVESTVVSLMVTDANATVIEFPKLDDLATPQIGDEATVNGTPADGSYVMPNGDTWNFVSGKLDSVVEGTLVDNSLADELEALKNENADLRSQLEQQATNLETIEASLVDEQTKVETLANSVVNLKKMITSKLDYDVKKPAPVMNIENENNDANTNNRFSGALERIKNLKN